MQNCPRCGAALVRLSGRHGTFWRCATFDLASKTGCAFTAEDVNGEPVERVRAGVSEEFLCMSCGSGLTRRPSRKTKGTWWWGCGGFPMCKQTYPDKDGRPDYSSPSR